VPDPTSMAVSASNARVAAKGGAATAEKDKTKVPMETAMWNKMRPIMHGLADVADTWERFGNALEPTTPFPRELYRLRLAAILVPLLAASIFTTNYMVVKGITFGIGQVSRENTSCKVEPPNRCTVSQPPSPSSRANKISERTFSWILCRSCV
jgi:hypothetical protein